MEAILNEAFNKAEEILESLKDSSVTMCTQFELELLRKVVIAFVLSKESEIYMDLNTKSGT